MVVLAYLAGKRAYRLRDIILMILAAGFLALILNPLVVGLQRRRIRRRGQAVAAVTIWTVLVFAGLVAAFGYPLAHGLTHFSLLTGHVHTWAEHDAVIGAAWMARGVIDVDDAGLNFTYGFWTRSYYGKGTGNSPVGVR